ncbi:MFS transporter [Geomicrobium sp. JCM 19055]|uniref:MFS transporter n=1 Tax=Geomicrobium sp. JCM 19055 TaxID=1460649 RepID=UPI0022362601|nr:MFS transporter [Geomicrobium sp. JCM 19055]
MKKTLLFGMAILSIAVFLRAVGGIITLLISTVGVGVAIALGNILIPALIKTSFPLRVGIMTAMYTLSMNVIGALASGIVVPIANASDTWRLPLQIWSILPLLAGAVLFLLFIKTRNITSIKHNKKTGSNALLRSPVAWAVTLFMGTQSLITYSVYTWLPDIAIDKGFEANEAGWLIALFQIGLIPTNLIVPILAARFTNQRILGCTSGLFLLIGVLGLIVSETALIYPSILFIGVGAGGAFTLTMLLFILRTTTINESSQLSSMAQSIGFLVAATGPIFLGYLEEFTQGWLIPLLVLTLSAVGCTISGYVAGEAKKVNT